jgi:hypothetical protein
MVNACGVRAGFSNFPWAGARQQIRSSIALVIGSQGLVGIVIVVVRIVDDVPTTGRTVIPIGVFIEIPVIVFIEVGTRRDVIPLIQSPVLVFAPRS